MTAEKSFLPLAFWCDVGAARETCRAGGEDALSDFFLFRRHDAVGGEEDRAIEGREFFELFPPRIAIVANKVFIFLESGLVVGRQHFAVGVDVDTRALGLLEQLLHVLEVMAGDQDGWIARTPMLTSVISGLP
jgi:hypothetical protein